jgi:hypothetical protein
VNFADCAKCLAPFGAAERVCRKAKAQGVDLRERGSRRGATIGLRLGEMALASHYGINL